MIGGAQAQTLDEALTTTYMNNPTLLSQRATVRVTDESVPQALSNWRPTVELGGTYGNSSVRNYHTAGVDKGQHRDPRSMEISVSQPIFRGLRTLAATSEAENDVLAARARLVESEQDVFLDTVTAFMDVVRDQAVLGLNTNNEQVLRRQLEATRDRFSVGEITRTDVHQAEARLARSTADRVQAEGNLEASRATYQNLVGEAAGQLVKPSVPADIPESKEETIKTAISTDPSVLATEFDEKAAADNVDQVRGELYPQVALTAGASRNYDAGGEHTRTRTVEAKLSLTVPLYQSGSVYSRLRAAKQSVAKARRDIDQTRRNAIEVADRAWESLQTAKARITSFQAQVKASQIAQEGVEREAEVGSRTVLDVLDAEQERLDAEVNLVRAQRDELVAVYQVKAATGKLTARHLNLPVKYYDPKSHYQNVRNKWFGGSVSDQ